MIGPTVSPARWSAATATRAAARVSLAAAVGFVVLLAALHGLKPELDPASRFISEYELGRHGWVMRVAFLSLAVSCVGLVVALRSEVRGAVGWLGLGLLLLSAVGMVLAAVYPPDEVNRLHEVGAMLDNVPFAALMVGWSLSRVQAWASVRRALLVVSWVPLLGLVGFVASMAGSDGPPDPGSPVGWTNRVMILAHVAWLIPIAWWAGAVAARVPPGPAEP